MVFNGPYPNCQLTEVMSTEWWSSQCPTPLKISLAIEAKRHEPLTFHDALISGKPTTKFHIQIYINRLQTSVCKH